LASGAREGEESVRAPLSASFSSWAETASGSASTESSTRRTMPSSSAAHRRCSAVRSVLPHSMARPAARCRSSLVESLKNRVTSTCSARGAAASSPEGLLRVPPVDSKN
jgi:hypothetical protein